MYMYMFVCYMQMYNVQPPATSYVYPYVHVYTYINNPTNTLSRTYLHKGSKFATPSEQTN